MSELDKKCAVVNTKTLTDDISKEIKDCLQQAQKKNQQETQNLNHDNNLWMDKLLKMMEDWEQG